MKKRYIAVIALAVMLISAAGCNNEAQTMPEEEISIVSTGLESTNTNEKNIDEVLNEIGQKSDTENTQSVQQSEQESSQRATIKERSKMTTPVQENSVEENNSQISENEQPSQTQQDIQQSSEVKKPSVSNSSTVTANYTSSKSGILDTADIFSERDLTQTADLSNAQSITVSDGQTINITEAGIYIISGSASNCTIKVNADKESKVQLVLNGVSITNDSTPAIYVVSADKCFITTAENTENTLSVTGTFTSDGDTNTDQVKTI